MKYVLLLLLLLGGCTQTIESPVANPVVPEVVEVVPNPKNENLAKALESTDKFLQGQLGLLILFILVQWIQLWYYSKTGKMSDTLKKASEGLYSKLSIVHRLFYKYIKSKYYKANADKERLPK